MKKYLGLVIVLSALSTQHTYTMESSQKPKSAAKPMLASDPTASFEGGTAKAMVKSGPAYQNKLEAVASAATISDALKLLEAQDPSRAVEYLKDRVNKKGKTPFEPQALNDALVAAVSDGNFKRVAILLNYDVSPNISSRDGYPLLHKAIDANNMELLNVLLSVKDLAPNIADTGSGMTPLIYAVYKKAPEAVKLLLKNNKVDVNAKDTAGRTALHWAAQKGFFDIGKLLIADPKIDLKIKTKFDHTALDLAKDPKVKEILEAAALESK